MQVLTIQSQNHHKAIHVYNDNNKIQLQDTLGIQLFIQISKWAI